MQGAKQWKQRRAVVLFRLFCCTKQTFASFNVDVFRQQGETQLTFQLLAQKQKWLFRCNLMVVLICARCKEVETASCSCFVSALLLHETNFCLFQRGRFQTTRRNTTDIPTACTKTKVAFSLQFDFLFVQGAKRWKQRRAVVLLLLFHCTKQTFASFNVDVFWQQGENVKFIDFATFFHIICFIQ